jgi:hypothetical protein
VRWAGALRMRIAEGCCERLVSAQPCAEMAGVAGLQGLQCLSTTLQDQHTLCCVCEAAFDKLRMCPSNTWLTGSRLQGFRSALE